MRNIGLIGKARSGKDTVAKRLCEQRGYERVAFADPLKDMALRIDPIICAADDRNDWSDEDLRLSEYVNAYGWEAAKDNWPEARRILQNVGQTVRELDADFWLRVALAKVAEANARSLPVVVSDVRYPNEAESLRRAGFYLIRITRPAQLTGLRPIEAHALHESETALDGFAADRTIRNDSTLEILHMMVDHVFR